MRLSWSAPEGVLEPRRRWRVPSRGCRRPHGLLSPNPGGFDAELKSLEEGIDAVCTVPGGRKASAPLALRASGRWPGRLAIERLRSRLRTQMIGVMTTEPAPAQGVLLALAIGDQAAIPAGGRGAVLPAPATAHLFSISGTHAERCWPALAAGVDGGCGVRRRGRAGRWGRTRAGPAAGRTDSDALGPLERRRARRRCAYSALAGGALLAQRTCLTPAAAGMAAVSGRARSLVPALSAAAACVLLLDPLAVTATGFWLSFVAVGVIVWATAAGWVRPPAHDDTTLRRPHGSGGMGSSCASSRSARNGP
jgi:competence protein ComEC